jgi:hypothetical protein
MLAEGASGKVVTAATMQEGAQRAADLAGEAA